MTIQNQKPTEPIISRTDIGYTIVKQRFGTDLDYDLAKVGGWSRLAAAGSNTAIYSEIEYDKDDRIFTWSGLTHNTDHVVSLSYLDDFILGSPSLIQAQYLQGENSLDLKHTNVRTKDPITITNITNEVDTGVVANPFSDLVFTFTGEADSIRIQVRKVGSSSWNDVYEGKPTAGLKISVAGGTYDLRYVSIIGFSDGTVEEFPARTYPSQIIVESGLGAPVEVSGLTLASFKTAGSTAAYDLRISWVYPTDPANQNKKRNFTVTVVPNPTSSTDYANLNWSSASEEVAITSPYVIKPFPYKTAYVVRIGVMGWGVESSDYVYAPVFISKDSGDSTQPGYLVPSDSEAPISTKIQIDDEHIRAYSVFNPSNPSLNKLMFEVDAATGNVIIGRAGGAYNNTAITTAPFIFDSQNNKLQISGRVITDQIESASYVMTWIDGESPSLRTAGKSGYGSGAPGIWMGYADQSNFMFDLGNTTNYMRWDGTNLTISGTVRIGNDGRTIGQAQKQVFIYKRSSTGVPATPTGGIYANPVPSGWSNTVPSGSDELYMSSRLLTSDGMPPQDPVWASPSLFQPGSSGTATTYTWIKYANSPTDTELSDDPTGKDYLGIATNKMSATESTNYADYSWSRLTGTPGVPGTPGADGQTLYTWVKYSPNANGVPMTDSPDASTMYIGVSPNQPSDTEGTNAAEYTWSKFKGDQGVPGVNNFKSTVFVRQDTAPGIPTGGTYASPIPTSGGWSDGIPSGNSTLWAATRIFAADNASPPHQAAWTTPVAMTSTTELEIRYSTVLVSPGDPSGSPGNWTSSASASTIWMAQRTRTNNTWSAWNVTKVKGEAGVPGTDGDDGKVLSLTASTQTITFNAQDVMTPAGQIVTFTVSRTPNILGSTSWTAVDDSGNPVGISGTNTTATLNGSVLASRKSVRVTATADGLADTVSVAKVRDGADAVTAVLSNESHGVPANKDGLVSSFVGADGYMKVYRGSTELVSPAVTFSVASSNGVTGSINSSGYYNVTAMSADSGTLTLRATVVASSTVLEKVFTVTKVKAGIVGARGAGQYSAVYTNPVKPITTGMAAAAKAACPGGIPVVGDIVTLYDSDPTIVPVSVTYNGGVDPLLTSSWDLFTVVIDGHLLVNGTVGADKINVNELYSKNAIISGLLQVGEGSTYTLINGGVGGLSSFVGGTTIFSATPTGGFLNGNYLGSGTVGQSSLSPELQQWIAEQGNGGQSFEFGGSAAFAGNPFASGTYTLSPTINLAAGIVTLNFSYGGKSKTVISAGNPGAAWITLQYKKNGVNLHASPYVFNGLVEELSTNEWYCSLPEINHSVDFSVPQGPGTFSVQVAYSFPSGGNQGSLGAFNVGAFQQPSGAGVTNLNLNDLLDVELASVTNGQALIFDAASGKWKNGAGGGGGGGATLTFGSYLTGGSYNGSAAVTLGVSASTSGTSNLVARDSSGNFSAGTITATLNGNATTATTAAQLTTARTIQATGDISWSTSFNGTGTATGVATLANSGVVANTYGSSTQIPVLTVDSKGRITGATTTTFSVGTPTSISNGGSTLTLSANGAIIQTPLSHSYLYFNSGTYGTIYGTSGGVTIQGANQTTNVATFQNYAISLLTTTTVSGTITATDCIATSDIRVKENLVRIDRPIERLKKLNGGYTFDRIDMDGIRHAGVIANYVKEALPEAIFVGKDSDLLTVSHSGMIGLLVEVCTEQQKRIEALEKKLNGNS